MVRREGGVAMRSTGQGEGWGTARLGHESVVAYDLNEMSGRAD